jgi:hypothetical protein
VALNSEFLGRLEVAVRARQGKPGNNDEIKFTCPSHSPDRRPSASYNTKKNAWCCQVCSAGGGAYHLADLLGVDRPVAQTTGLSLVELAEYVALPVDFLRSIGLDNGIAGIKRNPCVDIPYLDEDGEVKAVHKRVRISGEPRFIWRSGDKVLPYGLPRLRDARRSGRLLILEGDSDTWTAWYLGVPALGIPGASTLRTALARTTVQELAKGLRLARARPGRRRDRAVADRIDAQHLRHPAARGHQGSERVVARDRPR